jgi:putative membrane protein
MRLALLLSTIVGLGIAAWVLASLGLGPVFAAMERIGPWGFALLCLWSILVLGELGVALYVVAPGEPIGRLGQFIWSRATREAATDVLPFSQLGGLLVGARTLEQGGVARPAVHAALIADLTTEMASQLLFTLFGVAMLATTLVNEDAAAAVRPAILIGAALCVAMMAAFAVFQRPALALAGRLGERLLPGTHAAAGAVRTQLDHVYRMRLRVGAGFVINLAAWITSATGAWIALRFMGVEISLWAVLVIESLIFALRSAAFVLPGAIGVQEAAYLLLAPLFGLDPASAVALSLLKRGRDLALGVPFLAIWQIGEGTRLWRRRRAEEQGI